MTTDEPMKDGWDTIHRYELKHPETGESLGCIETQQELPPKSIELAAEEIANESQTLAQVAGSLYARVIDSLDAPLRQT